MSADDATDAAETAGVPCAPCRGTGTVVSNLGGSPSEVTCPWCEGSGVAIPGHDAQARRRGGEGGPEAA